MNLSSKLAEQLKRHEGSVKKDGYHSPYKCPADKLTVGYGRSMEWGREQKAILGL